MPDKQTLERVRADKQKGKALSTQAGEFIKEEIDHIRHGMHGARSAKQAIAIGLSKARRAGIALPPPAAGKTSESTRKRASRDFARGQGTPARSTAAKKRSRASSEALKRESREAASPGALARQARAAAKARSPAERSRSAMAAVRTRAAPLARTAVRKA